LIGRDDAVSINCSIILDYLHDRCSTNYNIHDVQKFVIFIYGVVFVCFPFSGSCGICLLIVFIMVGFKSDDFIIII